MGKRRRSRLIIFLAIALIIIVVLAVVIISSLGNQQITAGVAAGDVFTYDLTGFWDSNDPNATISDALFQLNTTEFYQVTITNVSGPEVSLSTLWRFANGTEIEGIGKVNIETGINSGGFWTLYAANLDVGKLTHPTGFDRISVNNTVTRDYPTERRDTNILILNEQYYNTSDPSSLYSDYRTIQFDKKTGMLVEFRNENIYNKPGKTEILLWQLTYSNVWTVK